MFPYTIVSTDYSMGIMVHSETENKTNKNRTQEDAYKKKKKEDAYRIVQILFLKKDKWTYCLYVSR